MQGLAARSPGNEVILQTLDQARKASQLAAMAVRPPGEIPGEQAASELWAGIGRYPLGASERKAALLVPQDGICAVCSQCLACLSDLPRLVLCLPAAAMVRDKNDPPGLREQVIGLFEEWLRVLAASPDDKAVTTYLHSLKAAGENLQE